MENIKGMTQPIYLPNIKGTTKGEYVQGEFQGEFLDELIRVLQDLGLLTKKKMNDEALLMYLRSFMADPLSRFEHDVRLDTLLHVDDALEISNLDHQQLDDFADELCGTKYVKDDQVKDGADSKKTYATLDIYSSPLVMHLV
jgi:hypothetical protein